MKHDDGGSVRRALDWLGLGPTSAMMTTFSRFEEVLVHEGVRAGVIGPNEVERVWDRHVADSVCFLAPTTGSTVLDVGSGAGLPGIPMAIARPDLEVTLLDRSGRRVDVVRRWVRVLGLVNVSVVQADIDRYTSRHDTLVFRGSLGVDAAIEATHRTAREAGVFGLSHTGSVDPPIGRGLEVVGVPQTVLDTEPTLLRITP